MREGLIRLEIKCLFYLPFFFSFIFFGMCMRVKIVRSNGVSGIMAEKAARSQGA